MTLKKENIGKTIHLQDDLLPENNIIHILQGPQFEAFSEEAKSENCKSSIFNY